MMANPAVYETGDSLGRPCGRDQWPYGDIGGAPPVLGQHTDEMLRDILGVTSEQIEELRASKVVA